MMENSNTELSKIQFAASRYIKEIGRGKAGARSLSRQDAQLLYAAMLAGEVSDLEMGGILLAMRIKGESVDEVAGFLDASKPFVMRMACSPAARYAPIVIPSYNGARKKPNLTPLLAILLARAGAPVLVHGVRQDAGRVTTAEIFLALGQSFALDAEQAQQQMTQGQAAFVPIDKLAPAMQRILAMRRILGVRNSTHTLVKLLQPFDVPALRLCAYTHPEYHSMLDDYFCQLAPHKEGAAFLMRGTEGEVVASTGRAQQIDHYAMGQGETLLETEAQLLGQEIDLPESADADTTAAWIQAVLAGEKSVPANIARQVELCLAYSKALRAG